MNSNPRGSILVATHNPQRASSGAGETDCVIHLCEAIRNAARIPGPGILVAEFSGKIPSAAMDPSLTMWERANRLNATHLLLREAA